MRIETLVVRCAHEGCRREAVAPERFCEPCSLEWSLFRRDTRPEVPAGLDAGSPELSPDAVPALRDRGVGSVDFR